ncbi:putative glycosyltransferase [Vibrio nigripulchritudo MADA3029]|uniref:glycosyltransferase family 2 protein n=1 Tax=Vibrio nigripulchritudo TaxID=28173 RepID=UPI0003B1C1BE|nr:glycosyltransferase family 2 protein [Vibrio nigripulchritudo]CCN47656.1 putative glycosyltransferase [Vibrio nigripulchritudo MADA3020]CCN56522.1 putative glycosyltransferase [Vibrio nigripulchritudo MADA3021]CCN58855.1 putative glycosyltransferase [Vibrio nigripulchritudo MADA3029]
MALFISVINHNHDDMICANPTLSMLSAQHMVIIKSNSIATEKLKNYCDTSGITLIQGNTAKGFGANNNEVFEYLQHAIQPDDYFLVLNPDVEITSNSINDLLAQVEHYNSDISAVNLFKDEHYAIYDNSIRKYPELLGPLRSLVGLQRRDVFDKSLVASPTKIDWAAGSFLLFKAACFEMLEGFDEKFFMYFEDADICTRANKDGFNVFYFPDIKAIHYASHQNRNVFSKHFYWYCVSALLYQLKTKLISD